jgi:hypothetical protein
MLSCGPLYMESTLICLMEKDNTSERRIDHMEDLLEQTLREVTFAAANNSTKLT